MWRTVQCSNLAQKRHILLIVWMITRRNRDGIARAIPIVYIKINKTMALSWSKFPAWPPVSGNDHFTKPA